MSATTSKIFRGTVFALLLSVAPVASAVGQEAPDEATIRPVVIQTASVASEAAVPQPTVLPSAGESIVGHAEPVSAEIEEANSLEAEADDLRPGQFIWRPERAESGEVEVVVSIERQMAYVYRAGTLIGVSTVSTGRRGHSTPTGSFTILQKNRRHFSNLYNNAPMPNMQRLTWGGIALHAGQLPGYPASHGCVRLPMEFSRLLFNTTSMGGRVHIIADTPPSAAGALAFATGETPRSRGISLASAAR
ncbi:MAG TPA: L,D-transpeptidase family protein [Allosphingosinicella sp.]